MSSYKTCKLNSERPRSSAKVHEYENSDYDLVEGSKIPKFPKRTFSLEGKKSSCSSRRSNTRQKVSTTSMIPRLEWKKQSKKNFTSSTVYPNNNNINNINTKKKIPEDQPKLEIIKQFPAEEIQTETAISRDNSPSTKSLSSIESKVNKDFINFKNNVLKIPEYWTDAGQTATNILQNAINIVSKQYPTVEKQSFETEIQNILKATEAVKQQILMKTETIINKATQIYGEKNETFPEDGEEDLKKITKKMEQLRSEVNLRKNVFGDLLKYGSEMKHLMEMEKSLKRKGAQKESKRKELSAGIQNDNEVEKKCKKKNQKREKNFLQSSGDVIQNGKFNSEILDDNSDQEAVHLQKQEKSTQTVNSWVVELRQKEKILCELNQQIQELQKLCEDHISRFKSFNLQIKLRGICNKAQHMSVSKELQILNDEKMQLEVKNSQLECYNKDLESAIKQKDMDLHQKDKLISQQKKLLHVRDELIEMLKNRCNLEEPQHY